MIAELYTPGTPPRSLEFGAIYQVLRGHQRPLVCALEEGGKPAGTWVVKPSFPGRQRGQGQLMALCELAGSVVCAYAGVPTPAVGVVRLPEDSVDLGALKDADDQRVAQSVLAANRGRLAFCSLRLETALDAEPSVLNRPRRRELARTVGLSMLLVDALIRNVDRRLRNPNALLWRGDLVAIDHGQAFEGIERAEDARTFARSASLAFNPHEHLLVDLLRRAPSAVEVDPTRFLGVARLREELALTAATWPDELDAIAPEGEAYKTLLVAFLDERLSNLTRTVDSVLQILRNQR